MITIVLLIFIESDWYSNDNSTMIWRSSDYSMTVDNEGRDQYSMVLQWWLMTVWQ